MNLERIRSEDLAESLLDARQRTLDLVSDLDDAQLVGPRLDIVNPLIWEIGHVAWFQERWALRHLRGLEPILPGGDALYDSAAVAHDTRWDLPLPSREGTLAFMQDVLDRVLEGLPRGAPRPLPNRVAYFHLLVLFHEDMHDEAFAYTRQTLGYPAPRLAAPAAAAGAGAGDVALPGGEFILGAEPDGAFVFDNEKWAHPVRLAPFAMARALTTQGDFVAFVEDGGYARRELWSEEGWSWRERSGAVHPVYWKEESGRRWLRRHFDRWVPLETRLPVVHVSWYEADAWCRWAGRRLPSEAEWECAAARAAPGALRDVTGRVWQWTASDFGPYPGFSEDPYREYSRPWFGDQKVLRGGCWVTRPRLVRATYRNFYTPDRRDVWAGFRSCPA